MSAAKNGPNRSAQNAHESEDAHSKKANANGKVASEATDPDGVAKSTDAAVTDAEATVLEAEEIVNAAAEEAGAREAEGAVAQDGALADALRTAGEYQDRYLRLQAEWDNYRKRTAAERESERKRAAEKLVGNLLPIVDDMERALAHSESASEQSLADGIAAVHSKLLSVLEHEGVNTIDPAGELFDATIHQAVGSVEDESVFDETVLQVYQKGYEIGGRCIRPAMVVVSKGGPHAPVDEDDESSTGETET